VTEHLSTLFHEGKGYSMLNTTRSALSLLFPYFEGRSIGDHYIIKRLLKGFAKSKPPRPKYNATWDPKSILTYIESLGECETWSLKTLSLNLVTMLALITAQRVQTLSLIKVSNLAMYESYAEILIPDRIKTSGPTRVQPNLIIPKFESNPKCCVFEFLKLYLKCTENLRNKNNCDNLLISFQKPHSKISSQTIGRWIKECMSLAGIDTEKFSAHSCRHAATSSALKNGVPVDIILARAGWTQSSSTFATFYNRPVVDPTQFGTGVFAS